MDAEHRKRYKHFIGVPLVVVDPHRLGVTAVAADLLIGGGFVGAVGVAHLGGSDPLELIEKFLQAPEAAAGQIDGALTRTSVAVLFSFGMREILKNRKTAPAST